MCTAARAPIEAVNGNHPKFTHSLRRRTQSGCGRRVQEGYRYWSALQDDLIRAAFDLECALE